MEPITEEEQREMRVVLGKIFDPFVVREWTINHEMYELLGKLMYTSKQCTRAMHSSSGRLAAPCGPSSAFAR